MAKYIGIKDVLNYCKSLNYEVTVSTKVDVQWSGFVDNIHPDSVILSGLDPESGKTIIMFSEIAAITFAYNKVT